MRAKELVDKLLGEADPEVEQFRSKRKTLPQTAPAEAPELGEVPEPEAPTRPTLPFDRNNPVDQITQNAFGEHDNDPEPETFNELVDRWRNRNKAWHFEGEAGVNNLSSFLSII